MRKNNLDINLKRIMKERKITSAKLAEKVFLNESTIKKYRRGVNVPSFESLLFLADALDVTLDELVYGGNE